MRYRAIIFDLDGTLLNTLSDLGNSVNRVLAKQGFAIHPLNAYRYYIGDGAKKLIYRALPKNHQQSDMVSLCFEMFKKDYCKNYNIETKLYDGVSEMLDELSIRGLKLAILSNKDHGFTLKCANAFLSKWKFEVIVGQKKTFSPKPNPFGALEISRLIGVPVTGILYVGDSVVDMQVALAAKMFPIGVKWGFQSADELRGSGAKKILTHPLDILCMLEK